MTTKHGTDTEARWYLRLSNGLETLNIEKASYEDAKASARLCKLLAVPDSRVSIQVICIPGKEG